MGGGGVTTRPVTGLAHHIKNFNVKLFANTDAANADARGSIKALPGLRPGELKSC